MCHNISSFFVMPTYHCATTAVAHSSPIQVGTMFMVPAVHVLPPRPPTVMVQVCAPVHVPVYQVVHATSPGVTFVAFKK